MNSSYQAWLERAQKQDREIVLKDWPEALQKIAHEILDLPIPEWDEPATVNGEIKDAK